MKKSLYKILGIKKGATIEKIRDAFKKLSKIHHPDKGGNVEKFREIAEAYEILADEHKRLSYDLSGHMPGSEEEKLYMAAFNSLKHVFHTMIADCPPDQLERADLLGLFQDHIKKIKLNRSKDMDKLIYQKRLWQSREDVIKKKIKRKGKETNLFLEVLTGQLIQLEKDILGLQHGIDLCDMSLKMLKDYDFEFIESLTHDAMGLPLKTSH